MSERRRYLVRLLVIGYGGIVAVFVVAFFVLRHMRQSGQDALFKSDWEIARYLLTFASVCFASGVVTLLYSMARKRIEAAKGPSLSVKE